MPRGPWQRGRKAKHFRLTGVMQPVIECDPVELVESEAVHSKGVQRLSRREPMDGVAWVQGWP